MYPTIRAVTESQLASASLLLMEINDDTTRLELEAALRASCVRWPTLQLAALDDQGALLGVATGALDTLDRRVGWSHDLVVAPGARKRGVGQALITAQLEAFRTLGCTRVRGQSPARLLPALPFFRKLGFDVIEQTVARQQPGIAEGVELRITEVRLTPG